MGANSSVPLPDSKEQWLESMAERLNCPICLEVFNDPVTLPCGHTLCKECVKHWSSASSQGQWICPLCKREDAIVYVERLDVNFTLKNLCHEYKSYCESKTQSLQCKGNEAALKTQATDYCERHPNELARYVCITCKEKFCGTCSALERKHSDISHQVYTPDKAVEPVTEIYNQLKHRVSTLIVKIIEKNETLTQVLTDLSATEASIKQHCTELKNKLCRLVDRQMSILLQPINNHEISNGISLGQLQQLNNDALVLLTTLEPKITEQNVLSRADAILSLLGSVTKLEQCVENHCQLPVHAIPPFHCNVDLNENMVTFLKESCGRVQEQDTVGECSQSADQGNSHGTMENLFVVVDSAFPTPSIKSTYDTSPQPRILSQAASGSHNRSHRKAEKLEARHMCSLPSPPSGWMLQNVAWVANYVLVADMKGGCIWCINHNSGLLKRLYQYDSTYKPFAVSVCRYGDEITFAVNVEYKGSCTNVNLHTVNLQVLGASDPLAHIEKNFIGMPGVGWEPVSFTRDLLCSLNRNLDIVLYSIHDRRRITKENTRHWGQVHIYDTKGNVKVYAKDLHDGIISFEVIDDELKHMANYDCSTCESISCLQTDKNGSLWAFDKTDKKLIMFGDSGDIICTLHIDVAWLQQVHSFHFTNRSIFMLVEVAPDSELSVICIPWPLVGGQLPAKYCCYALSNFIKR